MSTLTKNLLLSSIFCAIGSVTCADVQPVNQTLLLETGDDLVLWNANGNHSLVQATDNTPSVTSVTAGRLQSGVPATGDYGAGDVLWSFAGAAGEVVVIRAEGLTTEGLTARDLGDQGATFDQIYNETLSVFGLALFSADGSSLSRNAEDSVGYVLDCGGCQDSVVEDGVRLIGFLPESGEYHIVVTEVYGLRLPWYRILYHSLPVRVLEVGSTARSQLDEDRILDSTDDYEVWQVASDVAAEVTIESDESNVIAIAEPRHVHAVAGGGLERSAPRQVGRILSVAPRGGERGAGRRIVVAKNALRGGNHAYAITARAPEPIAGVLDVRSLAAGELGAPQVSRGVWGFRGDAGQVFGIIGRDTGWPERPLAIFSPEGEQLLGGQSIAFFEMATSYSVRLPQTGDYLLRFEPYRESDRLWVWSSRIDQEITIGSSTPATFAGGLTQRHWRLNCEVGQMLVPRLPAETRDWDYGWFEETGLVWEFELYSERTPLGRSGEKFLFCGDGEHWARVTLRDNMEGDRSGGILEDEVVREIAFDAVEAMPLAMAETVCRGYRGCDYGGQERRFGDLWRFAGDRGQIVEFRLEGSVPFEWYSGDGERLASRRRTGAERVRLSLPRSGWYYVWVLSDGDDLDSYSLRADVVGGPATREDALDLR